MLKCKNATYLNPFSLYENLSNISENFLNMCNFLVASGECHVSRINAATSTLVSSNPFKSLSMLHFKCLYISLLNHIHILVCVCLRKVIRAYMRVLWNMYSYICTLSRFWINLVNFVGFCGHQDADRTGVSSYVCLYSCVCI